MTLDGQGRPRKAQTRIVRSDEQSRQVSKARTSPAHEESRLRALTEAVGCITWTAAPDGTGDWSAWQTYTGQATEALANWGWLDALHPNDRPQARQAWIGALSTGTSLALIARVCDAHGVYRMMRVVGAPARGADGAIREWVGACLDTANEQIDMQTELQRLLELESRARAEAQAAEAQVRAMLDVLPYGIVISDADGTLVAMNQALHALWGDSAPLNIGISEYREFKAWWPATGQPVAAEEWGLARALLQGSPVLGDEMDIETFDGKRKVILNSAAPVRDGNGSVIGGVAVNIDITERKRLEAELAQRLSELENVFSSITDALLVCDAQGRLTRMNAVARDLLGLDSDHEDVMPPELARRVRLRSSAGVPITNDEWALGHILGGESIPSDGAVDMVISRPDGMDAQIAFAGAPIRDGAGTIIGAVLVGRDVTERRRLEHELRTVNAQLASMSAALSEQAQRLETTNRRMDRFLAMANHELKTPLTSLSANLQLASRRLRRGAPADERDAAPHADEAQVDAKSLITVLDRAQGATRRMTRLVNELLDVSRIQTGRLALRQEPCDLLALTRSAIGELRRRHAGRVVHLRAQMESAPVLADPDRVSEVIDNYLSNATKYSPDNTPIIVSLALSDDGVARVSVRDEGQGIPPETQTRIWNVFERLDTEAAQHTDGINLGLGLHICKTVIELHGGEVGVESAVGAGSTFWFTLPTMPPTR